LQIIVGGAGRIGTYLTHALIQNGHSVTVVDDNHERLHILGRLHDIAIRHGSITNGEILEKLFEETCDLFIGVTDSEEANILACIAAKKMGKARTVARLKNNSLLRPAFNSGAIFHVDHFVIPELLVAEEINRMVRTSSASSKKFFFGSAELRTITIPHSWRHAKMSLHDLKSAPVNMVIGAILRHESEGTRLIIPHGDDVLFPGDQLAVVTDSTSMRDVLHFFDLKEPHVKKIFINGGGRIGFQVVQLLQDFVPNIYISDTSLERCRHLAKHLQKASVIHQTVSDWAFIREQAIAQSDWYIGCGKNEEHNILTSLLSKELGCPNVLACINDESEARLAEKLGLSFLVSERIVATNQMIPWVHHGNVQSMLSLFSGRVEVSHVTVSKESSFIGVPLSELGPKLPPDLLIAVMYRNEHVLVADGSQKLVPGDHVIIITTPQNRKFVRTLF